MRQLIYHSKGPRGRTVAQAWLTTEVAESHYGVPVLVIRARKSERAYGWADTLPSGLTGAEFVRAVAGSHPSDHAPKTAEREAALADALKNIERMGL